ncbi:hypothetical protein LLS1_09410 [Leifsonia sp. LS1]|uniref:hypothetical protein n=1 Tax=Leifsonia sp. LS1 TaxID=2828483 RepID=UPI001CFCDC7E|nr:hypothetical protein [Leifsonia sp. LS1]GIT79272.1 hypothetical protein LLS1_09410 [Leifsonia sp. LS1]
MTAGRPTGRTMNPRTEGIGAVVAVTLLVVAALVVPAMLFPILASVALINVVRYAVMLRTTGRAGLLLALAVVNGVLFTVSAVVTLFALPL